MAEQTQPGDFISTPVATVQDIQHRLLRPPFLHSSFRQNLGSCDRRRLEVNVAELEQCEERGSMKRKLVDYLDPVLLAAVSARISRSKKETTMKTKITRAGEEFEWPVDELNVFAEVSRKNRAEQGSGEAVDLNEELEASCRGGGSTSGPFEWFEQAALNRFKR